MIDVHSHIIFDVDDGPSCIEQSLRMVKEADRIGIRTIIASPHYHEPIFSLEKVEENYQQLLYASKDYDVKLYLTQEVFVDSMNYIRLNNRQKQNINKAGLMLFEFPFNATPRDCINNIYNLKASNIVPVIAHIERNKYFIKDMASVVSLIKAGCYIQLDAASIIGVYGVRVKDYSKKLIQMGLVDMIASNAHCAEDYTNWFMEAYRNVARWVGMDAAGMLFYYNAKRILENKGSNVINTYNNITV